METFVKQPSEKQTRAFDYSGKLSIGAASISSATVSAIDTSDGTSVSGTVLTSTTAVVSGYQVRFTVQAGTDGKTYKISTLATLNTGDILEDDVLMKVKAL